MKIPIINFKNLVSIDRIFEIKPSAQGEYIYMAIFFGLCLIISFILSIIAKRNQNESKKVQNRVVYLLLVTGIVGLILIFLRWQSIPYLGSRFMIYLLGVMIVTWIIKIILYRVRVLPRERIKKQEKENFEKYLPRPKKRVKAGLPKNYTKK